MRNPPCKLTAVALVLACSLTAAPVRGVDLEAFEFNDPSFTELSNAVNAANPGNRWSTDINILTDSFTDGSGNYRIGKFNDEFVPSYLQIANIDESTSSRFLVARIASWDLRGFDAAEPEEIRFAFLNDDTGTSGNTVTAQMQLARNTATEQVDLIGDAIGVGSTDLDFSPSFGPVRTTPLTMVLELDKKAGTYEVFYKDGVNPSQSLGIGTIASGRTGNSLRWVINNNFGTEIDEFLAVDRVALADANPLTDLLTLEIDRTTGVGVLRNTTGGSLSGLESYTITSEVGALNTNGWKPIADHYDRASGPGDGSVDADDDWAINASTTLSLSEAAVGGNGGNLALNQAVVLSTAEGLWLQNPTEDLQMQLQFTGGVVRRANVNFFGNNGRRFETADLNFDGALTVADWTAFIAGAETDLTGLSVAQAYQLGDLNNDGENNIFDFALFKDAYDAANGTGALEAAIASLPEPSSILLAVAAASGLALRRRRGQATCRRRTCLPVALAALLLTGPARAAILEDFQFDDPNGTLLQDAENSVPLGATWNEDAADMSGSSVLNGVYRIQKDNEGFGTNYLNTTNFSTGKAWLVAEITGWNFTTTLGTGEDPEEIRFAFLNNDTGNQGGSTITGQAEIQRNDAGNIELIGGLLQSGPDFGPLALTHSRTSPFTVVLEIDEDSENYSVYYKDGDDPFVQLGTAPHVAGRDGNSVRMVANNSFSGTGEFFDIDRIYVTDMNPLDDVPLEFLTLAVNPGTGAIEIRNDTAATFEIDSYRIESTTSELNFADWASLSDRNPPVDPVDGPDANPTAGDGIGETWDEAAGSDNDVLAESFLLGSSAFTPGRVESLGNAFQIGGDTDALLFQYRNADTGSIVTGNIELVTTSLAADRDGDLDVDGRDFLSIQRTDPSLIDSWQAEFGSGVPAASVAAVPEPAALLLVMTACMATLLRRPR